MPTTSSKATASQSALSPEALYLAWKMGATIEIISDTGKTYDLGTYQPRYDYPTFHNWILSGYNFRVAVAVPGVADGSKT
jgi:hypothetical protein